MSRLPEATLFRGGRLITMDPDRRILAGDLLVSSGRIVGVGPGLDPTPGARVVELDGQWVTPGLIQGHVHFGQTLFRGLAEDRRLLNWLHDVIWPLEAAHDDQSAYWSGILGALEAIRGGTTTVLDIGLVHGQPGLFRALADSGLRAWSGKLLMDRGDGAPSRLLQVPSDALAESRALEREWDGAAGGRIRYAVCPRFVYSCSRGLWEMAVDQARGSGTFLHTHAFETREEQQAVQALEQQGELQTLDEVGALSVPMRVAHGVWIEDSEADRLAGAGASVIHCPASNLKLGSGVADLQHLAGRGIRLGLGCDGSPCNNFMDPIAEMRLACLLQTWRHGPGVFTARRALELATIEGAAALGADAEIGSLEVGKRADFAVFDLDRLHSIMAEEVDPFTRIVFGADRTNVTAVYVDGRPIYRDGQFPAFREEEVMAGARESLAALLKRAGWR